MIRIRICTNRCRCQSSCRRSRFSGLGTQIRGKRFSSSSFNMSRASSRSVFLWQAAWKLHRTHSVRGLQCRQAATGTHQQAGQYCTALFAGGSIASSRTVQPGLATSVYAPADAPGKKNCQSGHGQKTRCSVVLDVAKQLAIFAVG